MAELARLNVLIGADLSELEKKLKASTKSLEDVGAKMQAIGGKLSAAVTLPLVAVGAAAVKMAADAQEASNKFDVVMGPAADRMRARIEELHKTIPLARHELIGLAAGVQDMLVPFGVAREQAAGMSVDMVELAGDLAAFNDVSPEDALLAIQSALAGSSEPMLRFGVDTRVASLEAIALANGLIKEGQALDGAARAQAVMLAIQKDSTDAQGAARREAEGSAASMRFFGQAMKDLSVTIGDALLPVITPLIQKATEITKKFQELSPETQKKIVAFGALAAAIGPVLVVLGTVAASIGALVSPIGLAVAALAAISAAWVAWGEEIKYWVPKIIKWVFKVIDPFEFVSEAVGLMYDAFKWVFRKITGREMPDLLSSVKNGFSRMKDTMVGSTDQTVDLLGEEWQRMQRANSQAMTSMAETTKLRTQEMAGAIQSMSAAMVISLAEVSTGTKTFSEESQEAYLAAKKEHKAMRDEFEELGGTLDKVEPHASTAKVALASESGLTGTIQSVIDKLGGPEGGLLGSIGNLAKELGVGSGFQSAIDSAIGLFKGDGSSTGLVGAASQVISKLAGKDAGGIVGALASMANEMGGTKVIGAIAGFVKELVKEGGLMKVAQAVASAIQGVVEAIRNLSGAGGPNSGILSGGVGPIIGRPSMPGGGIFKGGFASGGFHSGGLRLVGERGPELEATGAARIWSNAQTRDMIGGDQSAVIRTLQAGFSAIILRQDGQQQTLQDQQRQLRRLAGVLAT